MSVQYLHLQVIHQQSSPFSVPCGTSVHTRQLLAALNMAKYITAACHSQDNTTTSPSTTHPHMMCLYDDMPFMDNKKWEILANKQTSTTTQKHLHLHTSSSIIWHAPFAASHAWPRTHKQHMPLSDHLQTAWPHEFSCFNISCRIC